MNDYKTMKEKQQKEFNAFPIKAAFSEEQFREMMTNWGLNANEKGDLAKVTNLFGGVYVQKKDLPALREISKRHKDEFEAAVAADQTGEGFIYQMFYYELCNHEYGYTGDVSEAIEALGFDTIEEVFADERLEHGLKMAARDIMESEEV